MESPDAPLYFSGGAHQKSDSSLTVHRSSATYTARTYRERCATCIWGCQIAVEMIIDQ